MTTPIKTPWLHGSHVALVTPFKDGMVDEATLRDLVRWHLAEGTDGLVPCGTTGEAATLTEAEWKQVVTATVDEVKHAGKAGQVPVVAGTGHNSTAVAIGRTALAKKLGVDAALVVTPYYNKPTQEGLYQHYKAIVDAVHMPVVIYNVPGRTAGNILPETVERLADLPEIVAAKEACGNLDQITALIGRVGDRVAVMSGDDGMNLPVMAIGGTGGTSVLGNLVPADNAALFRAVDQGDLAEARRLHHKYHRLVKALFMETSPLPVKTALALMGRCREEFRLPLCPMSATGREALIRILVDYELIDG